MIKSKLRRKILKIRNQYSNKLNALNPDKIYKYLKKKNYSLKSIGGYFPSNHETDDLKILNFLMTKGSNISLPVIKKNYQMDFFQWANGSPLKINKYGIPEPISNKKVYPDILFIPMVAFDSQLNRLGYGGGYYDRYIEKISKIKKTIKIGLAFSFQQVGKIPTNKHDKKLDLIITNKAVFK